MAKPGFRVTRKIYLACTVDELTGGLWIGSSNSNSRTSPTAAVTAPWNSDEATNRACTAHTIPTTGGKDYRKPESLSTHTYIHVPCQRATECNILPCLLSSLAIYLSSRLFLSADHLISCIWIRRTRVERMAFSSWTHLLQLLMTYEAQIMPLGFGESTLDIDMVVRWQIGAAESG